MTRMKHSVTGRCLCWLLALFIFLGTPVSTVQAADEETLVPNLKPDDLVYEDGNIILHKTAERIGKDEWKVTVRATIGEMPVEKRQMEVVFLLDISSSMDRTAHTHSTECNNIICGKDEHAHTDACYGKNTICGKQEHVHNNSCTVLTCGQASHPHSSVGGSCYTQCTRNSNSSHWSWSWQSFSYTHNSGTSCAASGNKYYYLSCTDTHHTDTCYTYICNKEEHTHTTNCYPLQCGKEEHAHTNACRGTERVCGVGEDTSRFGVAVNAAENLISSLPENTIVTRLAFDRGFYNDIDSYYDLETGSGTYMWTAITKTLTGNYFSDNESTKKVFVILTDGEATDSTKTTAMGHLDTFKLPDGMNGAVFTVGFAYDSEVLGDIAGNGGYYMYAEDATSLMLGFEKLEQTLTAMLEDPMGTTVSFDRTTIDEVQTSGGTITSSSDTIYWTPAEDGSDSVRNSTIEYKYTVKLNANADIASGEHVAPLNNPTYFRYGIKSSGDENPEMKEALFPIPVADYALSSVQTKWQYNGRDIQTPLAVEKIFCDYQSATYIPAFKQDYRTITPVIPVPGSNDYYRYIGTSVTANGTAIDGVDAVDATQPVHYEVIHQYMLVQSHELPVTGTKTLVGRDFQPGDSFTFTLTPVTEGAPMPEHSSVTITPTSGTSAIFDFGTISYNTAGVYTYAYTIQEQSGDAENIIYDTTQHTMVVTVTEVNGEMVVSYTMDGVENGHLAVNNRLETGSLMVQKRSVTSHLPEHQTKAFGFVVEVRDASNRPLNGVYAAQKSDGTVTTDTSVTFTNGYTPVTLKPGESIVILDLPDGASYKVTEDAAGGFTATATGNTGTITAHEQSSAVFDNEYHAAGLYQFIGTKKLEGATLARDQFSFSVLDENGNVVATGKNNADGNIFLTTLRFTEADEGTKTYTIVEDAGSEPGILYDRTRYTVTLTIIDDGDGTLAITDDLNGTPIVFTNKVMSNYLTVSKTVEGTLGSKNREFTFTLTAPDNAGDDVTIITADGVSQTVTLNAQGQTDFVLKHDESIVIFPLSGSYTVTENDTGSYTASCSIDGAAAVTGSTASGTVDADGTHVAFVNTLQATTPTGVNTSTGSAFAGICLAVSLLIIMSRKRRCC